MTGEEAATQTKELLARHSEIAVVAVAKIARYTMRPQRAQAIAKQAMVDMAKVQDEIENLKQGQPPC